LYLGVWLGLLGGVGLGRGGDRKGAQGRDEPY
jgi:hypothetical protein